MRHKYDPQTYQQWYRCITEECGSLDAGIYCIPFWQSLSPKIIRKPDVLSAHMGNHI